MKNIIFILFFPLLGCNCFAQETQLASCCDGAKCTGSSSCRACTNCSSCAHCNSGGSCGVCSSSKASYKTPSTPKTNTPTTETKTTTYNTRNDYPNSYSKQYVIVTANTLNLRKGPGTNYEVVETLSYYDRLELISTDGDWYEVKTVSGNVGYVSSKFIKVQ